MFHLGLVIPLLQIEDLSWPFVRCLTNLRFVSQTSNTFFMTNLGFVCHTAFQDVMGFKATVTNPYTFYDLTSLLTLSWKVSDVMRSKSKKI